MIYPGIDGLCGVASSFDWIGAKDEDLQMDRPCV